MRFDGKSTKYFFSKIIFLRHLIILLLTIFSSILMIDALLSVDDATFQNLSWIKQSQYLMSLSPILFSIYTWLTNIWSWSELIVLLTNPTIRITYTRVMETLVLFERRIIAIIDVPSVVNTGFPGR